MSPRAPASLRAALRRVPLEKLKVLEPACGPATYLSHFGPGSVGIDRNPEVARAGRAQLASDGRDDVKIQELNLAPPGWSEHLEVPFDAAFLCDVVMHIEEPAPFLAELAKCLLPGAPVVLVEWTLPRGAIARKLALAVPGAKDVFTTKKHFRTYHPDELLALFAGCGFTPESTWIHSFEGRAWAPIARGAIAAFWPARTWLLRSPA